MFPKKSVYPPPFAGNFCMPVSEHIRNKLSTLPHKPGVYLPKTASAP